MKGKAHLTSDKYKNCINYKTFELEACSLQELLDNEDFHQFHVDETAWMPLLKVETTQAKLQSLIDATDETKHRTKLVHTDKKRPADYSPQLYTTWVNYSKTFHELMESVEHEVLITTLRGKVNIGSHDDIDAVERRDE